MLDIRSVALSKGFSWHVWHDWSSFLPGMNWRDFCFVHASGEFNSLMGRIEAEVCVLGVWLRVVYVYNENAPTVQRLREYLASAHLDEDAV
jgi:hypothetical protein